MCAPRLQSIAPELKSHHKKRKKPGGGGGKPKPTANETKLTLKRLRDQLGNLERTLIKKGIVHLMCGLVSLCCICLFIPVETRLKELARLAKKQDRDDLDHCDWARGASWANDEPRWANYIDYTVI